MSPDFAPKALDFAPLLSWYEAHHRPLPWRESPDPYRVLVSEFMLQQTRADVVIPYYARFLERFPTLASLTEAESEDVLPLWSGLGYYRRARSLHQAARSISQLGTFPAAEEDLIKLPGIGAYTAAAISSIAFGRRAVALDGNAARALSRLLAYRGTSHNHLRQAILPAVPLAAAATFTQAIIELGATLCKPRSPLCDQCPMATQCVARIQGSTEEIPPKARSRAPVCLELVALRCRRDDRVLLEKRLDGAFLKEMWMVPYRLAGDDPASAVEEILTGLRLGAEAVRSCGRVQHQITFRKITVEVFEAEVGHELAAEPQQAASVIWAHTSELSTLALPSFTRKILIR